MFILLIVLPLSGGFLTLLLGFSPKFKRLVPLLALTILVATFLLVSLMTLQFINNGDMVYSMGGFSSPIGIDLRLDGLSILGSAIGLAIIFLATCHAYSDGGYGALFYSIILLLTASMQAVLLSNDIFNIYVYLEVLSVCSYFLIAYKQKVRALKATLDYLFISSLAFSLYIIGVALIYKNTGVLGLDQLSAAFSGMGHSRTLQFALSLILTGLGVKTAFFPLHTWLPDAHSQAPAPVSAILSGIMIKVSFLCVWRIVMSLHLTEYLNVLVWIGLASALVGGFLAMLQVDIKRLLACSSISQMGFIIAALGSAQPWGEIGSINVWAEMGSALHVVSHATFKTLLFLCAGIVITRTGQRDLRQISGLRHHMPVVSLCLLVGICAISGIPGFNGFISKTWIYYSVQQKPVVYWTLIVSSMLTVVSMLKLLSILWGPAESLSEAKSQRFSLLFAPITLAAFCLYVGLFPETMTSLLRHLLTVPAIVRPMDGIYTIKALRKSSLILLAGVGVYLLIRTTVGTKITGRLRQIQLTLNGKLLLVVVAALGFFLLAQM